MFQGVLNKPLVKYLTSNFTLKFNSKTMFKLWYISTIHALTWRCFIMEDFKITKQPLSKANSGWQFSTYYYGSVLTYIVSQLFKTKQEELFHKSNSFLTCFPGFFWFFFFKKAFTTLQTFLLQHVQSLFVLGNSDKSYLRKY